VLIEFASAVHAVDCTVAIGRRVSERAKAVADDRRIVGVKATRPPRRAG
jgi:hypothetical protein